MGAVSGFSVETGEYWKLIVVFGLAFLSLLLLDRVVTGAIPELILISVVISLVVAFVATVGYDKLFTGDRNRRPTFWTRVGTAYPVAVGIYTLALFGGIIFGASSTAEAMVGLVAALIGVVTVAVRVKFRD